MSWVFRVLMVSGAIPRMALAALIEARLLSQFWEIERSFPAPLALVVQEEERLVLFTGAAEGAAELILAQRFGDGRVRGSCGGLQERAGVEGVVLQIVVERTVQIVGAGLGDDVDDAAHGAALLRT